MIKHGVVNLRRWGAASFSRKVENSAKRSDPAAAAAVLIV